MNILANVIEDDGGEELLGNVWLRADEDFSGFVAGVCGPGFGTGKREEEVPLGKGRDDFERFGEFARFVAGEEEADSMCWFED